MRVLGDVVLPHRGLVAGSITDVFTMLLHPTQWLRNRSLATKIVAVTMGASSAALLLACAGLLAYDRATARSSLSRDIGILAEAVGANSTAAVLFADQSGGRDSLKAVAANRNVRLAALLKDGAVFARFDRGPATTDASILTHLSPDLLAAPAESVEFGDDVLRIVRPIVFDGELLGGVYIELDLTELRERQQRLLGIMALVLTGSLGAAFVLSSRLQRVVSGPVLRLTAVTREVSRDKKYDIRVEAAGRDEVGVLIDGFNEMLGEIQRRDRQLTDYQEALEREVAVRTADLRAANVELLAARDKAMAGSRAKSEFLANISHEIRTPMNGIVGMTELALDSPLSAEQRDCLETVQSSAASLLGLLNDILDLSKIESRKIELDAIPFSLGDVVEDTLKRFAVLADKKGVELIADVDPALPRQLTGDPGRVAQILTNLVGNAIKFTEHGHVLVAVRAEDLGSSAQVQVAVTDTGIGIPGDKHEAIFEAFSQADGSTTRRFGGTGLGLTISASLLQLMGGRLWLESDEGCGSTFQFTIALPVTQRASPQRDPVLDGLRVLIVDDSETNRRVLCSLLERWGMEPSHAADGASALERLAEAANGGRPFRLTLLDATMPATDGFALLERIAAPHHRTAVVMMLASSNQLDDSLRCQRLGIDTHVTKPVRHADLRNAICRALQMEPRAAAPRQSGEAAPRAAVLRVLLAEDNLVNQKVALGLLARRGHAVTVVGNGLQAVAAWESASFDVVLMDVQMPEMSGVDATRAIREREAGTGRHTRIIAMTAHAMEGDRERYLASGMDDYVAKPIDYRVLIAAVESDRHESAADDGDAAPGVPAPVAWEERERERRPETAVR